MSGAVLPHSQVQEQPLVPAVAAKRRGWRPPFALVTFVICFLLNMAGAYVFNSILFIGNLDGLARTANAFYVLFSRDPHLAAIGFVWPVLPSLTQIPVLAVVQRLGAPEYSGAVLSSMSGAGVIVMLGLILGRFNITGISRFLILAPVAIHPQLFYQSSAGVAEMPFLFFIIVACYAYFGLRTNEMFLVLLGFAVAMSFLVRYESFAFVAGFTVLLLFFWRRETRYGRPEKTSWLTHAIPDEGPRRLTYRERYTIVEGRIITTLTPFFYALGIWILFNWLIMGDPLFFLLSQYSLAAAPDIPKNVGAAHPLFPAMKNVVETGRYALERITDVQIGLVVLIPLAILGGIIRRDYRVPVLFVLMGSIFGFTAYQVYSGSLPSYIRYWMYATPFAVMLTGVVVDQFGGRSKLLRFALSAVGSLLLIAGGLHSVQGLADSRSGQDEQRLGYTLLQNPEAEQAVRPFDQHWIRRVDAPKVAAEMDRRSEEGIVMVGVESEFYSLLKTRHPDRLAIVSDRDYQGLLEFPANRVKYIFGTVGQLGEGNDVVSRTYPGLYDGKVPWAKYVGSVPGTIMEWKIFEVDFSDPAVPDGMRIPKPTY